MARESGLKDVCCVMQGSEFGCSQKPLSPDPLWRYNHKRGRHEVGRLGLGSRGLGFRGLGFRGLGLRV